MQQMMKYKGTNQQKNQFLQDYQHGKLTGQGTSMN